MSAVKGLQIGGVNPCDWRFFVMKYKIIFSFLLAAAGMGNCLAQVPDSVRQAMQVPVFQQDTLPVDSILATPDSASSSLALPTPDSLVQQKRGFVYRIF